MISNTKEILIVDDLRDNAKLLQECLSNQHYKIRIALNGETALLSIEAKKPDLILLDVNMPKMNGFEVCKRLKADDNTKDIPIIFISGNTDVEDKVNAFKSGGIDYITKPFANEEVIARVNMHLELNEYRNSLEKKVSEEINKNEEKNILMLQQSRMAQMGEMISMIAHQWRQPLGAISSTSIDLNMTIELDTFDLKEEKGREECQTYFNNGLKGIDKFVKSLTNTIDDFRNFYKPNKQSDTIKLEEVCKKSLAIIKTSLINNNINIIEDYCCDDKLNIYTNEMTQVVLNILKNSQDNFLEKDIKNPYIKITTKDKVLSICDNGGGIPDDIMDKVFDPYFSTKDEKNGTGLGLYMSKTIIEEHHNATLTVKNTDGGVCFMIEFV